MHLRNEIGVNHQINHINILVKLLFAGKFENSSSNERKNWLLTFEVIT
jgi:hypothetical protein